MIQLGLFPMTQETPHVDLRDGVTEHLIHLLLKWDDAPGCPLSGYEPYHKHFSDFTHSMDKILIVKLVSMI